MTHADLYHHTQGAIGGILPDSPIDLLRASGSMPADASYDHISELVFDAFRARFDEISHTGQIWSIDYDVDGPDMCLSVYLHDADGRGDRTWESLGMSRYDKRTRCENGAECRMWLINLDEHCC